MLDVRTRPPRDGAATPPYPSVGVVRIVAPGVYRGLKMGTESPIELSIIIVNWNSRDFLQKCIASILDAKIKCQHEIIVIDSGSFDGSREMVKQCYPPVKFI